MTLTLNILSYKNLKLKKKIADAQLSHKNLRVEKIQNLNAHWMILTLYEKNQIPVIWPTFW